MRGQTVRKSNINRDSANTESPGFQVAQNQNLRGSRQRSGIPQFLNDLAEFELKKDLTKREGEASELRDSLKSQALIDSSTGEVSDELMDQQIYAETLNAANGQLAGLRAAKAMTATLERDMQLATEAGEEFDLDLYLNERMGTLTDSPEFEDRFFALGAAEPIAQARAQADGMVASAQAKAQVEEASNILSGFTFELAQSGQLDVPGLSAKGDSLGLTRNEIDAGIAEGVLSMLSQAESVDQLAIADQLKSAWSKSPAKLSLYGDDIARAERAARKRIEASTDKDTALKTLAQIRDEYNLDKRIEDGTATPREIDQALADGIITPGERETKTKALFGSLDKLADEARQESLFMSALDDPSKSFLFDDDTHRDFKDFFNRISSSIGDDVLAVTAQINQNGVNGELRAEMNQILEDNAYHIETGQAHGFTPSFIKRSLSIASDPAAPNMQGISEMAMALSDRFGEAVTNEVPNDAMANLRAYRMLTTVAGLSPEAATQAMTDRVASQSLTSSAQEMARNSTFKSYVKDLPTPLQEAVASLAGYQYRLTGDAADSATWAYERFKSQYMKIDDRYVPRGTTPPGFDEYYKDHKDVFEKWMRDSGHVAPGADVQLVPAAFTATTGDFLMISDGLPVANEDGEHLLVSANEISQAISVTQQKSLKQNEATAILDFQRRAALRQERLQNRKPTRSIYDGKYYDSPVFGTEVDPSNN